MLISLLEGTFFIRKIKSKIHNPDMCFQKLLKMCDFTAQNISNDVLQVT